MLKYKLLILGSYTRRKVHAVHIMDSVLYQMLDSSFSIIIVYNNLMHIMHYAKNDVLIGIHLFSKTEMTYSCLHANESFNASSPDTSTARTWEENRSSFV